MGKGQKRASAAAAGITSVVPTPPDRRWGRGPAGAARCSRRGCRPAPRYFLPGAPRRCWDISCAGEEEGSAFSPTLRISTPLGEGFVRAGCERLSPCDMSVSPSATGRAPAAPTRQPGAKRWTSTGCFPKRAGGRTLQLRHSSALKAEAPRLARSRSPLRDPARTAAGGC